MLSALITVLLLVVMLSIIVGFMVSAVRLHRRQKRTLYASAQTSALVIPPALAALTGPLPRTQDLMTASSLPASWFRRRRTLISMALLVMAVLTLFVQSGLADGALQTLANGLGINPSQHLASFDINTALPPIPFSAAANVVRVDSAARDQYYS